MSAHTWLGTATNEDLGELRMYALVHRSLSGIQKGIQAAHAMFEYAGVVGMTAAAYDKWRRVDKTMILLNGGSHGELVGHCDTLREMSVLHAYFTEVDMNECMTAVAFLLPERVWNRDKYPDFKYDEFNLSAYTFQYDEWTRNVMDSDPTYAQVRQFVFGFRLA